MADSLLSPHGVPLTDLGNAERFVRDYGNELRYVRAWREWLYYDGRRWTRDATGQADRMAKDSLRVLVTQSAEGSNDKENDAILRHALRSASAPRVRSMLELASTEPEVAITVEMFDRDPWLLNLLNGTLDLRSAEIRDWKREDLITKVAPVKYEPDASCPRWEQFLEEILAGDREMIAFVQRAVGYSLTGDTREQVLFFAHGGGANGKSVFCETLHALLGPDYAQATPFSTFLSKRGDSGPNNDIARMRGARLVTASEAPGARPLDEVVLKQIVGGDTLTARFLHQEFFEFRPQFKLWLRANHRPPVREQTHAFWRRMRLIPFTVTIPESDRDRDLPAKLAAELPGILSWAIRGCIAWQRDGLGEPAAVTAATTAYRVENDTLGEYLEARCVLEPRAWTSTADLYNGFVGWWEMVHGRHEKPLSRQWFGRALGEREELRQEPATDRNRTRGWRGVRLTDGVPVAAVEEWEAREQLPF